MMPAMPSIAHSMSLTHSSTLVRGTDTSSTARAMSARSPTIHPASGNRSVDHTAYSRSFDDRNSSRIDSPSSRLKRSGTLTPMTPPTACPVAAFDPTLSMTSPSRVLAGINSVSMITGAMPARVMNMSGLRPPWSTLPILSPRDCHAWRMLSSTSAMLTFMVASAARPRGALSRLRVRPDLFNTAHLLCRHTEYPRTRPSHAGRDDGSYIRFLSRLFSNRSH